MVRLLPIFKFFGLTTLGIYFVGCPYYVHVLQPEAWHIFLNNHFTHAFIT
jgi:hypothetical protein